MMNRKAIGGIFLLLFLLSCSPRPVEPVRVKMQPQVLSNEIVTTMPGDLFMADEFLVWSDPFARDYFIHVHDASTGKVVGTMGKVGEGPQEFVTPSVSRFCVDRQVFAQDANGNTVGYLSLDSLLLQRNPFITLTEFEKTLKMGKIDKGVYLTNTEDGDADYFRLNVDGKESTFGVYPVRDVKQHVGGYEAYHPEAGWLVYVSFRFPYMALYKREGDAFQLQWERKSEKETYEKVDDHLVFDRKIMGAGDVCMSKDYIITLERDREVDPMDESTVGRNASKCPRTVFLRDYNGNLLKIIDLGMPVMRITADLKSNALYAIGVNPDFMLAKYDL